MAGVIYLFGSNYYQIHNNEKMISEMNRAITKHNLVKVHLIAAGWIFSTGIIAQPQPAVTDEVTATVIEGGLEVITSADPGSNAVQSFIVIAEKTTIPQGIKDGATVTNLTRQIPFEVKLKNTLADGDTVKWKITVPKDEYGKIETDLSGYSLTETTPKPEKGYEWTTEALNNEVANRHILKFRPTYPEHKPTKYKMGRNQKDETRVEGGGGSVKIDQKDYNPRLTYSVSVEIVNGETTKKEGPEKIKMDNRDMIRQEYINHYGRESVHESTSGKIGKLNVPKRNELTTMIKKLPAGYGGGSFTSSEYKLMIDEGMGKLAKDVVKAFNDQRTKYNTEGSRLEYLAIEQSSSSSSSSGGTSSSSSSSGSASSNSSSSSSSGGGPEEKNYVEIPTSKFVMFGWRNPERNEWYSIAINSQHQLGGALDISPKGKKGSKEAAILYWVLWVGIENGNIDGWWQLEDINGSSKKLLKSNSSIALKNERLAKDIDPDNGIPDIFDESRHLHIDIKER